MDISFFKIFKIFGLVSSWAEKSLEDGKITIQETVDLAEGVSRVLGIVLEVDFSPSREKVPIEGHEKLEDLRSPEEALAVEQPGPTLEDIEESEPSENHKRPAKRPGEE